jgi:hypothetical protein
MIDHPVTVVVTQLSGAEFRDQLLSYRYILQTPGVQPCQWSAWTRLKNSHFILTRLVDEGEYTILVQCRKEKPPSISKRYHALYEKWIQKLAVSLRIRSLTVDPRRLVDNLVEKCVNREMLPRFKEPFPIESEFPALLFSAEKFMVESKAVIMI